MRFTIEVSVSVELELDEVWPDGDAPQNPTAADVAARIADSCSNATALLRDWGLADDAEVTVLGRGTVAEVDFK